MEKREEYLVKGNYASRDSIIEKMLKYFQSKKILVALNSVQRHLESRKAAKVPSFKEKRFTLEELNFFLIFVRRSTLIRTRDFHLLRFT